MLPITEQYGHVPRHAVSIGMGPYQVKGQWSIYCSVSTTRDNSILKIYLHVSMMAVNRRTRDEQVLEAIFNPENPVTDIEVSGGTISSCTDQQFLVLFLL